MDEGCLRAKILSTVLKRKNNIDTRVGIFCIFFFIAFAFQKIGDAIVKCICAYVMMLWLMTQTNFNYKIIFQIFTVIFFT